MDDFDEILKSHGYHLWEVVSIEPVYLHTDDSAIFVHEDGTYRWYRFKTFNDKKQIVEDFDNRNQLFAFLKGSWD